MAKSLPEKFFEFLLLPLKKLPAWLVCLYVGAFVATLVGKGLLVLSLAVWFGYALWLKSEGGKDGPQPEEGSGEAAV